MRNFEIDTFNKTVNFSFNFEAEIVSRIKQCGYGARWNPVLKLWIVTIDDFSKKRVLEIIRDFNFKQNKQEQNDIEYNYEKNDVDYAYLKGLTDSKDFAYTPRKYQLEALGYSMEKQCLINGDSIGIGKTFESILYAEVTNSFPCLVVVPASVKYNWFEKWLEITKGRRSVSVIESKETKKRKNNWDADVVVINYDITAVKKGTGAAPKFIELVDKDWKMVIFDEAHFLKEKKSQRSKVAAKIVKGVEKIQLLTGTAVMNKPVEIWNLLKLIGKENEFADDWFQFIMRYCGGYKGKFGWVTDGATNTLELNKKLRSICYIRREKSEVMNELPAVTKEVLKTPINNLKTYNEAVNNLYDFLIKTKGEESAEKAMEAEHLVAINVLRTLAIEGKYKAIVQYLKDWKTAGKGKLLVFGLHRQQLQDLAELFKCDLIAGGVSAKKKQELVHKFKKDENLFMFANMQSAGTGIDGLQDVCSNMLIIELPWRPSDLAQAIGRLYRSGQLLPVLVTFMLAEGTIDMDMWDMLADKEAVTEAVNKGKDIRKNDSGLKSVLKKILKRGKER